MKKEKMYNLTKNNHMKKMFKSHFEIHATIRRKMQIESTMIYHLTHSENG